MFSPIPDRPAAALCLGVVLSVAVGLWIPADGQEKAPQLAPDPESSQEAAPVGPAPPPPGLIQPPAPPEPVLTDPGRTDAGRFVIYGPDVATRSAFVDFARSVDADFRSVLKLPPDFKYPITIQVKGQLTNPSLPRHVTTSVSLLEGNQYELQLFVSLSTGFRREELSRELVRLLLTEQILEGAGGTLPESTDRILLPPWVHIGIAELVKHRHEGQPSDLFAAVVTSSQVLGVDDIFAGPSPRASALDRQVYEASAAALISALLDQVEGVPAVNRMIRELAAFKGGDRQLLLKYFPDFRGDPAAIDKWLSLQVARLSELQAFEYLPVARTEALLDDALHVSFPPLSKDEEEKVRKGLLWKWVPGKNEPIFTEGVIHDFEAYMKREDYVPVLEQNLGRLQALGLRCFPVYRGVVDKYVAAVSGIVEGKTRNVDDLLEDADEERIRIALTMQKVEDHLNFYEATKARQKSRAFDDYEQTLDRLDHLDAQPRTDRISRHLDAMDREFSGE